MNTQKTTADWSLREAFVDLESSSPMAHSSFMFFPFSVIYNEEEEENERRSLALETDDDEYIESLLRRESCFCHPQLDSSSMESSRPDVVRWIMKTKAFFGLCSRTAYVALSYFDHFMHRTTDLTKGKCWKIQLLSVACLSLAVKMEECKAMPLTEFQTEDYRFDGKVVQRMELLVLNTLEWRMNRVTPFSYLNHCSSKFGSKAMEWKAINLIFENMEVMNLVAHRASSIAAASILAAQDEGLTQKSLKSTMNSVSWMRSLNSDEVFSCYITMIRESQKKKLLVHCLRLNNSADPDGTVPACYVRGRLRVAAIVLPPQNKLCHASASFSLSQSAKVLPLRRPPSESSLAKVRIYTSSTFDEFQCFAPLAGRHSGYRDLEFWDREADVELSGRKDYYRDRLHDGGLRSYEGRGNRDLRDRIGVAQRDTKNREVTNGSHHTPCSSNSSEGSKNSQKMKRHSGKDVDRETGELSSGSGSDDAQAPISKIQENVSQNQDNENYSMDSKKRKFSPIIWDRDDGKRSTVPTSSSKNTKIDNDTLPPPPPRPQGFVPPYSLDDVLPSAKSSSPFDSDAPVESSQYLLASTNQEEKLVDDFEDEPVPARSISFSRWADGNSSFDDGGESFKMDVVTKRKKSSPLAGSTGQYLHKKMATPKVVEVNMAEISGVTLAKLSDSREHGNHDEDAELGINDVMDIDLVGSNASSSNQMSETDSEDEDQKSETPEPAQPPKRCINMLQGCRSVDVFERLNKIDEGTYGVVYRAKDKKTGEIVALKKVKMEKETEGFPLTALREINVLLSFHHPSVVDVKEVVVGSSLDKIFMVMEYMEHDLKALMETMKQPFSQSEVKCLMLQLFSGVNYLHDNWVLHRDLKTSNLLLNNRGELKICDFGLARQYGSPLKPYSPLVVTLWYRAPELLLGAKEYSTAIDMWSLGCIMAELLAKEPLFNGKSEHDQLDKIFRTLGTPNEKIWPGIAKLPGAKVNFVKQPYNKLREKFPPTSFFGRPTLSEAGFDLLNKLLTYDPEKRITAEAAQNHPWFQEVPLPKSKDFMPTFPAQHAQDRRLRRIMKSPDPLAEQRKKELQLGELGLSTLFG